ncbi:hypothetical protein [Mycoplasmopsis adleri]|uniref:hypothetical protein n=1 Tax=Mycoplasmopsis adleri TaxID=51362 RepID=UPI003872CD93
MNKKYLKFSFSLAPVIALPMVAAGCGSTEDKNTYDAVNAVIEANKSNQKLVKALETLKEGSKYAAIAQAIKDTKLDVNAKIDSSNKEAITKAKNEMLKTIAKAVEIMINNGGFEVTTDAKEIQNAKANLTKNETFVQVYKNSIGRTAFKIITFSSTFTDFYNAVREVARISTLYPNTYGGETKAHANGANLELVDGKLAIKFVIFEPDEQDGTVLIDNLVFKIEK